MKESSKVGVFFVVSVVAVAGLVRAARFASHKLELDYAAENAAVWSKKAKTEYIVLTPIQLSHGQSVALQDEKSNCKLTGVVERRERTGKKGIVEDLAEYFAVSPAAWHVVTQNEICTLNDGSVKQSVAMLHSTPFFAPKPAGTFINLSR